MFIEIESLELEPLHVRHEYGTEELSFQHDDAALAEPVSTDFTLTHKDRDLRVAGFVRTTVRYQCSRCLVEFSRPLESRLDLFYLPQADWKKDEEIELKYEDMVVGYYDGIRLDVDLMVLEQIELGMPMKFICREGCKGLCPSCGADLNQGPCACKADTADTRFAVLREFRSKMNNK